ncbi:MAG: hypothetical protein WCT20_05460 [Candidatus Babeliales bacterium]
MKKIILYLGFLFITHSLSGAFENKISSSNLSVQQEAEAEKKIRAAVEEALRSFDIDPKTCTIVMIEPSKTSGLCSSDTRTIAIDKELEGCALDYVAYHEVAHLYDQIDHKARSVGRCATALGFALPILVRSTCHKDAMSGAEGLKTLVCATLGVCSAVVAFRILGEGYCYGKGELRADRLAVEHLLKAKRFAPIVYILARKLYCMAEGEKSGGHHPSYEVECRNILQCLRDSSFDITFIEDEGTLNSLQELNLFQKKEALSYKPQTIICLLKGKACLALATSSLKLDRKILAL